nr:MAG TPA: hypothetical protein [Caudoviricetes sp.]
MEISPDKNHQSYLQHQNPNNHYSSVSTRVTCVYHGQSCHSGFAYIPSGLQVFTMTMGPSKWKRVTSVHQC